MICTFSTEAQNVQLHYDFGNKLYKSETKESRPSLVSTVEMFRADKFGSTYFFVDMEYYKGVNKAYWEISREFNFWQNSKMDWLSAHIEYNGGVSGVWGTYDDAFLFGATYSGHSKDFSKTWSISASYKLIPKNAVSAHNFQITAIWGITFLEGYMTFKGFIDFWQEHWSTTKYIILAEPQVWLNFNAIKGCENLNLSVGTEVELSNNFVDPGFYALPTIAVKWTF